MATKFRNVHIDALGENESIALQVSGACVVPEGSDQNGVGNPQGLLKRGAFKASAMRSGTGSSSASSQSRCGTSGRDMSSAEASADGLQRLSLKIYQPS
jgi:hypothetical protein